MDGVRLILTLHDHQPVGNFDSVFDASFRDGYLPFLDVMEGYPEIAFVLHTSGPLLEWLVEQKPDYVARLRALVDTGRLEMLGGGFYEPILPMIPHRDRVGQIRDYSAYLAELFGRPIRGMWMPERVWEQHVTSALAEAGIEYTVLDDFHFQRAGLAEGDLYGYYLTEDDGRLVKVFPGSERLRYLIPFQEPHATYEYLRRIADEHPGATLVFADDGEKLGAWPETHDHVYTHGWLRRFCDMLVGNRDWLQTLTLGRAVDATLPLGKIYLPDSSYREMTEWVLPPHRLIEFEDAVRRCDGEPAAERLRAFARAGGFWRNFKSKYAETDEMYARMLGVSQRLAATGPDADPDYIEVAKQELYRGQCNCAYWHGAFGGLYLPHLRNAVYHHLIAADNALDEVMGLTEPRVSLDVDDFNLDARQEVRLQNDRLIAFVGPARGGHIYELDVRNPAANVLATLDRRPEAYHGAIAEAIGGGGQGLPVGAAIIRDKIVLKHQNLDRRLVYDRYPRKALVDHFYPRDVTLDDLAACRDVERGDFVLGTYLAKAQRGPDRVSLIMERPGHADGHNVRVRKTVSLEPGSSSIGVDYVLEDLPASASLHFAVELNLAGMAGHADDRYFADSHGQRLGMLDSCLDLPALDGLSLTDEWLDLSAVFHWSQTAGIWCFPIETVSQSESGFEGVYQSSAVIPHWLIHPCPERRWEVRLTWRLDHAERAAKLESLRPRRAEYRAPSPSGRVLG
jgi:alpha-amylase